MIQFSAPKGTIIMYNGDLSTNFDNDGAGLLGTDVEGWQICNGKNGSPNLINQFVMGADTQSNGIQGGQNSVTLDITNIPAHDHGGKTGDTSPALNYPGVKYCSRGVSSGVMVNLGDADRCGNRPNELSTVGAKNLMVENHSHTIQSQGNGVPFDNRPSFVGLGYLMKQ